MTNGFININKASDMTSHDIVNIARKIFNTKKIGHGGTLDPFATGVLPLAIGRATKFIEYVSGSDKSYRAEILFGVGTDTGDITGNVISRTDFKMPPISEINAVLDSFIGTISQTPPKFSAIKINGRKAYELARKNVDFTIPARQVEISKISVINVTENTMTIDVDCSKGTYIRSLAVDIGSKLNTSATLKTLQRTKFGSFELSKAVTVEELRECGEAAIMTVDECIAHLPRFDLQSQRLYAFCNGLPTTLQETFSDESLTRVYVDDEFIGVGKIFNGEIKAVKIYKLL